MVITGLDKIASVMPEGLRNKRLGVLCHAASVTRDLRHITEVISDSRECILSALFGPQHGIHGQTQDNMIEWEGYTDKHLKVPVYSLYGRNRRPTPGMLSGIDALVVDLQDAGARLYTYIWTVKECMQACSDAGIPVWILDRPNPVGLLDFDGPLLKNEFFTFVGGASIPLCHRMTLGEMALWVRNNHIPGCDLTIIRMDNWNRNSLYADTGLPWILPSPNLPRPESAIVYPGTVLMEATNLSEGRGTTIPFELFGAPWLDSVKLANELNSRKTGGCFFRKHDFIPTFHKYTGEYCEGIQIHVTDPAQYRPVETALHIFDAIMETTPGGSLKFNPPPYEYEEELMPFDILSGDDKMRLALLNRLAPAKLTEKWKEETTGFISEFNKMALY